IFSWLLFLAAIGTFVFFFQVQVKDGARQLYNMAFPCTVPVSYKLGTIDKKFGISKETIEKDLASASKLWNDAAGKKLFVYDPQNGNVMVSLEYDSRQAMTQRLKSLGVTISTDRESYEIVKARY